MAMFNLSRFSILRKQTKHCDTGATFVVSLRLFAHEQRQERQTHTHKHPMVTEAMTAMMDVDSEQMIEKTT